MRIKCFCIMRQNKFTDTFDLSEVETYLTDNPRAAILSTSCDQWQLVVIVGEPAA